MGNRPHLVLTKCRECIIWAFPAGFLVGLLLVIGVDQFYYTSLPETPEPQDGRTNRILLGHGFVRYGSLRECRTKKLSEASFVVGVVMLLVAIILRVYSAKVVTDAGSESCASSTATEKTRRRDCETRERAG